MSNVELLIKIPEEVKVAITRMGLLRIPDEMQKIVDKAIQSGTPIPGNAINEIIDIVNNPSKHIKILKVNGEDTICYSQQFIKLLELLECIISERR